MVHPFVWGADFWGELMRIAYTLLSPTFGMHQYTADMANRAADAGHAVHLLTTTTYPADRYAPNVSVHTPLTSHDTGFSPTALLQTRAARLAVLDVLLDVRPDVVHITGPHLWNLAVLAALRRAGIPTIHTLHDLDPHPGTSYGPLLHLWNRGVLRRADHILVHAERYQKRLLRRGYDAARITCTPLLHLFLGHTWLGAVEEFAASARYEPFVLFFGRVERYKGVAELLTAWALYQGDSDVPRDTTLVLAGPGHVERLWAGPLPPRVEVRSGLIGDAEALDLFHRCALVVLPYMGATQSALIPAAYFFRKPVMASASGALDEYVEEGRTGWIIEPRHPASLARCLAAALAERERLAVMGQAGRAWYEERRGMEETALEAMLVHVSGKSRLKPRELNLRSNHVR